MTTIIETERLILRTWRKEDAEAYFKINQDPKVIEFVLGLSTLKNINDFMNMVNNHQDKKNIGVEKNIGVGEKHCEHWGRVLLFALVLPSQNRKGKSQDVIII